MRTPLFQFAVSLVACTMLSACNDGENGSGNLTGLAIREARPTGGSSITVVSLPGLTSNGSARANGISPDGKIVVGSATGASGVWKPVKWTLQSGSWRLTSLASDPAWTSTSAIASTSSGMILGRRYNGSKWEAVVWMPGGSVVYFDGYPTGINSSGVISGNLNGPGVWVPTGATTWTRVNLVMPASTDGTIGGGSAEAIDEGNVVAGYGTVDSQQRAVRWAYSNGSWGQGVALKGGAASWALGAGGGVVAGGVWVTFGRSCDQRIGALWTNPSADPVLVPVPNDAEAMWVINDVNDTGDVVGMTKPMCASNGVPAWLSSLRVTTTLPLPKGTSTGEAIAVSARGSVTRAVGYAGNTAVMWALP